MLRDALRTELKMRYNPSLGEPKQEGNVLSTNDFPAFLQHVNAMAGDLSEDDRITFIKRSTTVAVRSRIVDCQEA